MVLVISFVDCYFDFRFCFGHIFKDACFLFYRIKNENIF